LGSAILHLHQVGPGLAPGTVEHARRTEESRRLKRAVADLTLDKQILKEAIDHLGNG
jgi:hypothetical protein